MRQLFVLSLLLLASLTSDGSAGSTAASRVPDTYGIKFDEYHRLSFKDEKKRLNNYTVQLKEQPEGDGYILVRDGSSGNPKELKAQICRSLKYLFRVEKLEPTRITAAMGIVTGDGPTELTIDLWILPRGGPLPELGEVDKKTARAFKGSEARKICGW